MTFVRAGGAGHLNGLVVTDRITGIGDLIFKQSDWVEKSSYEEALNNSERPTVINFKSRTIMSARSAKNLERAEVQASRTSVRTPPAEAAEPPEVLREHSVEAPPRRRDTNPSSGRFSAPAPCAPDSSTVGRVVDDSSFRHGFVSSLPTNGDLRHAEGPEANAWGKVLAYLRSDEANAYRVKALFESLEERRSPRRWRCRFPKPSYLIVLCPMLQFPPQIFLLSWDKHRWPLGRTYENWNQTDRA